ncbi:hypothetical protein BH23CHL7_BH23CHL7_07380 [soil metagenome]
MRKIAVSESLSLDGGHGGFIAPDRPPTVKAA